MGERSASLIKLVLSLVEKGVEQRTVRPWGADGPPVIFKMYQGHFSSLVVWIIEPRTVRP